jgi:hypothetical protein
VTYVKGQRMRVVGYISDDPLVVVNGAQVRCRNASVSLIPGDDYAPGKVTFWDAKVRAIVTRKMGQIADQGAYTEFSGDVTAAADVPNAFLVLLAFEQLDTVNLVPPKVAILGKSIGKLEAGKDVGLGARMPPLSHDAGFHWAALVFSDGLQVRDEGAFGGRVLSALFDEMDRIGLNKVISQRNTGDFPAMVYRHFPLRFNSGLRDKYAGRTVNVRLSVSTAGIFDSVEMMDAPDPELAGQLAGELRMWLFIPKIVGGHTQPTDIVFPLKF